MLQIYGVPISVHTRKVIVAACHKRLPYQLTPVVPVIPGNPPANWRSLSPTGLIPAITDGDFTLADSTAICAYLERLHPEQALYPVDARGHARALWFEQYAGMLFGEVVRPLFHEVFVHPRVRQIPTDPVQVDAVLTQAAPQVLGYLETAAGEAFLAGATMTMADVAVVSNLVTLGYIGFAGELVRYPRLAALFERVIVQPAFRAALRGEVDVVAEMGLDDAHVRRALA
jgi:glutathione S-transferase